MPPVGVDRCVIYNPASGKGRGRRRLDSIRTNWADHAEFWPTRSAGHAVELARAAADAGFNFIVAAGGDGTVHEVANGILISNRPDVCLVVAPVGSANDYAHSLESEGITAPRRVDVGMIRWPAGVRYFVCCAGAGFNSRVTLESRKLPYLQGKWLYGLAAIRALWSKWDLLDVETQQDEAVIVNDSLFMLSMMIGQREGGFIIAPGAKLADGWMDCVRVGSLNRGQVLRLLPRLAMTREPLRHPQIRYERCRKLLVRSRAAIALHTDGELAILPTDDVREFEAQIVPHRLLVQVGLGLPT